MTVSGFRAGQPTPGFLRDRVYKVSGHDPEVLRAFYRAMHMLDGPSVLLRPDIMLRVLLG